MSSTQSFADGAIEAVYDTFVGNVLLNRPERKNAVNAAMWSALPDVLNWLLGQNARVILLSGAGGKDFSAGADIVEFDTHRKDAETSAAYEKLNSRAFAAIRNCPVPVIAVIRGFCFGGGFGLAAAADIRIADTSARFAVPAARLGLAYPVDAMGDIVAALGPQLAKVALFTTREFTAAELADAGALLPLVEPHDLDTEATALAQRIAYNAPLSVRASKTAINAVVADDPALMKLAQRQGDETYSSRDYAEGRAAFKDRRKPHFTGQ
ncbi:enoyl-CoA hydratase-related protein [Rhizobium sp. L1K21]|uniref:enoyl-CoA hydratase-related protein n=1 Tax=Rhizobium sp. L1K21 TaxID=2954933 RepID=UPI0020921F74|nr:enoyl-CoA hydratase-related protein [Rhizobium sp. L1K21]MCO6185973.1 enoyl-CoA hydratase-related protein [Rhizobium sp. L1K21]